MEVDVGLSPGEAGRRGAQVSRVAPLERGDEEGGWHPAATLSPLCQPPGEVCHSPTRKWLSPPCSRVPGSGAPVREAGQLYLASVAGASARVPTGPGAGGSLLAVPAGFPCQAFLIPVTSALVHLFSGNSRVWVVWMGPGGQSAGPLRGCRHTFVGGAALLWPPCPVPGVLTTENRRWAIGPYSVGWLPF